MRAQQSNQNTSIILAQHHLVKFPFFFVSFLMIWVDQVCLYYRCTVYFLSLLIISNVCSIILWLIMVRNCLYSVLCFLDTLDPTDRGNRVRIYNKKKLIQFQSHQVSQIVSRPYLIKLLYQHQLALPIFKILGIKPQPLDKSRSFYRLNLLATAKLVEQCLRIKELLGERKEAARSKEKRQPLILCFSDFVHRDIWQAAVVTKTWTGNSCQEPPQYIVHFQHQLL